MVHGEGSIGVVVDGRTGPQVMMKSVGRDWGATFYFGKTRQGKVRIGKLVLEHGHGDSVPGDGITVALLDAIGIGTVRRYLENLDRRPPKPSASGQHRGRPAPLTRQGYQRLLRRYGQLIAAHDPCPAKTLAEERDVKRSTMRTWLRRARELG